MATTSSNIGKGLTRAMILVLASLVAAGLGVTSCGADNDAMILVRVSGTASGSIYRFQVQADAEGDSRSFSVPERPRLITLPTSFSLQVPPDYKGRFAIALEAYDDEDQLVAEGSVLLNDLRPGEDATVDLQLEPVTSPRPDGGAKPTPDGSTMNATRKDASADGDNRRDGSFDAAIKDAAEPPTPDDPQPKLDAMVKLDTQPPPEVDAASEDAGVVDAEGEGNRTP